MSNRLACRLVYLFWTISLTRLRLQGLYKLDELGNVSLWKTYNSNSTGVKNHNIRCDQTTSPHFITDILQEKRRRLCRFMMFLTLQLISMLYVQYLWTQHVVSTIDHGNCPKGLVFQYRLGFHVKILSLLSVQETVTTTNSVNQL